MERELITKVVDKDEDSIEVSFHEITRIVVYTYSENSMHTIRATGYNVHDGYLHIVEDGIVVATYNRYQWISVRV